MEVRKAITEQDRQYAFEVRNVVFVQEQEVAPEEEYDEFDETATHFIALDHQANPCGTARWRKTKHGIKLERFAVLKPYRSKGVGAALLMATLQDIELEGKGDSPQIYLHAQTTAIPFYEKFGFRKKGEEFEECNIKHFLMTQDLINE